MKKNPLTRDLNSWLLDDHAVILTTSHFLPLAFKVDVQVFMDSFHLIIMQ